MKIRTNAKARAVIEAIQAECERLGVVWGGLQGCGKHYRATILVDGEPKLLMLPSSPSDKHTDRNKICDLRRIVRETRQRRAA